MLLSLHLVPPYPGSAVQLQRSSYANDDHALIEGIRRGEAAAATALYHKYEALVRRTLVRILGFDSELADVVQETFIRALGSTRRLRDPQALPSWILRIAVCTASDLLRKRRNRRWLQLFAEPHDEELPTKHQVLESESDVAARDALRATYSLLKTMPTAERIAFTLRRFEGMELTEVALACGCSLATVKRRLLRAEAYFFKHAPRYPELNRWLHEHGGAA
jgi:RNA polymerase sigma-70 factor (ECF subfamily)